MTESNLEKRTRSKIGSIFRSQNGSMFGSTIFDEESHLTLNTLSASPLKANKKKRV